MHDPYSVENFQSLGAEALAQLAGHLSKVLKNPGEVPVHPAANPKNRKKSWGAFQPLAPVKGAPDELLEFSKILQKFGGRIRARTSAKFKTQLISFGTLPYRLITPLAVMIFKQIEDY